MYNLVWINADIGFISILMGSLFFVSGAACHGMPSFPYSIKSPDFDHVTILKVPCISLEYIKCGPVMHKGA